MNVYVLLRGGESKRDGEVYTKWVFAILVRTFSFRFPLFLSSDRFLFFCVNKERKDSFLYPRKKYDHSRYIKV